jgi:hypothetical protein
VQLDAYALDSKPRSLTAKNKSYDYTGADLNQDLPAMTTNTTTVPRAATLPGLLERMLKDGTLKGLTLQRHGFAMRMRPPRMGWTPTAWPKPCARSA